MEESGVVESLETVLRKLLAKYGSEVSFDDTTLLGDLGLTSHQLSVGLHYIEGFYKVSLLCPMDVQSMCGKSVKWLKNKVYNEN